MYMVIRTPAFWGGGEEGGRRGCEKRECCESGGENNRVFNREPL